MAERTKTELEARLEEANREIARLKNQISELRIDVHQATRQHQGYLYMERAEYRRMAAQETQAEAHEQAHREANEVVDPRPVSPETREER